MVCDWRSSQFKQALKLHGNHLNNDTDTHYYMLSFIKFMFVIYIVGSII